MNPTDGDLPEGYEYRYVKSYWHWGLMRRLYAAAYGLQAFKIRVRIGGPRRLPPDRVAAGARPRVSASVPKRPVKRVPRPRKSS
ncbi:MAG: hypothetical protein QM820_54135 [Minicystis sp.]